MKLLFSAICSVAILNFFSPALLRAQKFNLVRDLDTTKSSYPSTANDIFLDKTLQPFTTLNGFAYFSANDGIHGNELWRSDGTPAGTSIVADVFSGLRSCNPQFMKACNNRIFFSGASVEGYGLIVTDGTPKGTKMVKQLPGITILTPVGNTLYFVSGTELWKSDGTASGTVKIIELRTVFEGYVMNMTSAHGKLFLRAANFIEGVGFYSRLWTSDGTADGTKLISENILEPDQLVEGPGNTIYFSAYTTVDYKRRLYIFNGQPESASPAPGNNDIVLTTNSFIVNMNNTLYFAGSPTGTGTASTLYRYDINAANGTTALKTLTADYPNLGIGQIVKTNNQLFMLVSNQNTDSGAYRQQLWRSDGTGEGTILLRDSGYLYYMAPCGNPLYFNGSDTAHGLELWRTDGTVTGTVLVSDILPGSVSSDAGTKSSFCYVSGKTIFNATNTAGNELWVTMGTAETTKLLKNINETSTASSYIGNMTAVGDNKLFFLGQQSEADYNRLWKTDGTSAGTVALDSIEIYYSSLPGLPLTNDSVYFCGLDHSSGKKGLFVSNGIKKGTRLIKSFDDINISFYWLTKAGNLIYIATSSGVNKGSSLWRSDGTEKGTFKVVTSIYDLNYFNDFVPLAVENIFYFNLSGSGLAQIWRSDGTAAGTRILKNSFKDHNPDARQLTAFKGKAFFIAKDNDGYKRLWQTDGTDAGTQYYPNVVADNAPLKVAGDRLCFNGHSEAAGYELWSTDGTANGASLLKDVAAGVGSSYPSALISAGGLLYFSADDGEHGTELWKSNGTAAGTMLVKDITPGRESSSLSGVTRDNSFAALAAGKVFLSVSDQLWVSNGTDTGTYRVNDEVIDGIRNLEKFVGLGNDIWLLGATDALGEELYHARVNQGPVPLYTFEGTGDFDNPTNWLDGLVPPQDVFSGMEVMINPSSGGQFILTKPLHFKGGKLTIAAGAKITIPGNLVVQ